MLTVVTASFTPVNVSYIMQRYSDVINLAPLPPELLDQWFADFKINVLGISHQQQNQNVTSTLQTDSLRDISLENNGSGIDLVQLNFVIFIGSLLLILLLITLLVCLMRANLPSFLSNVVGKLRDKVMFNMVFRFVVMTYQSKVLDVVVTLSD